MLQHYLYGSIYKALKKGSYTFWSLYINAMTRRFSLSMNSASLHHYLQYLLERQTKQATYKYIFVHEVS